MRDNTSEGVFSLEEVVLDWSGDFIEDNTIGVENLEYFEHVEIVVKYVLCEDTRDQQTFLDALVKLIRQLYEQIRLI